MIHSHSGHLPRGGTTGHPHVTSTTLLHFLKFYCENILLTQSNANNEAIWEKLIRQGICILKVRIPKAKTFH